MSPERHHKVTDFSHRTPWPAKLGKPFLLLLCFMIGMAGWQVLYAESEAGTAGLKVGSINASPTNKYHPGKAVWVDLVTTDVVRAANFYSRVFGWEFEYLANGTYAEASYKGHPIGAIARYSDDEAVDGDAQWLVSFSHQDLDNAVSKVDTAGGKVLEGPTVLEGRGRWLLIADPGGAESMLLHAMGGDPSDRPSGINEWLWAELWTNDTSTATKFYLEILGLKSRVVEDSSGKPYTLLGRDGVARAGVVSSPFKDVEPNWLPYMLVENIKNVLDIIEKNGGKLVMAPGGSADQVTTAIVSDPTGGVFAIQQKEK